MDELPTQPVQSSGSSSELAEVKSELAALQNLVFSMLVLVIVASGAFNLYLLREYKNVRNDNSNLRPQAQQARTDFEKNAPALNDFIKKLAEYSRTHPDFAPIATKFGLNEAAKQSVAPAAPAPAKK
jgi:hypothetical protein